MKRNSSLDIFDDLFTQVLEKRKERYTGLTIDQILGNELDYNRGSYHELLQIIKEYEETKEKLKDGVFFS